MKRHVGVLICAITMIAFAASIALGVPQYAQKTGKTCTFCHKKPTGGREFTSAGQYYAKYHKLPPAVPLKPGVKAPVGKKPSIAPAAKSKAPASAKKPAPATATGKAAAPAKKATTGITKKPTVTKKTSAPAKKAVTTKKKSSKPVRK